jgi:hypothetical protein
MPTSLGLGAKIFLWALFHPLPCALFSHKQPYSFPWVISHPFSIFYDDCIDKDKDIPFYDSFGLVLEWIGKGFGDTTLHDFVPPSLLHELDFMTCYGMMYIMNHGFFVLELSLFWFMMEKKGAYFDTMLE